MVNEELQQNGQEAIAPESPAELTPEQTKAKKAKLMTVITYCIALACIVAGIFAPLFGLAGKITDRMFLKYIPGVVNYFMYPFINKNLIPIAGAGFFSPFILPALQRGINWEPPTFEGYPDKFSPEMFASLSLIIFVLVAVAALFVLIPVLIGDSEKRTYAKCAYVIEILAALSAGYFFLFSLTYGTSEYSASYGYYSILIACLGPLVMMAVQSVYNKGGLGVTKIILMVLSTLLFLFMLNLCRLLPFLGKVFNPLSKALGAGEDASFISYDYKDKTYLFFGVGGIHFINELALEGLTFLDKLFLIVGGVLICVCMFNLAYDVLEIAVGYRKDEQGLYNANKPMNIIAVVRYGVALLLAAVELVFALMFKGIAPGLFLYAATLIILIQLIFAIVRFIVMAAKRRAAVGDVKKAAAAEQAAVSDEVPDFSDEEEPNFADEEETYEEQPAYEQPEEVYEEQPVYEEPDQPEEVYEEQPVYEEPEQPVYEQPVYEEPEQPAYEPPVYAQPEEPAYEPVYEQPDDNEQLTIPGTPAPEPAPVPETEERTFVYNYRAVYNGPTDAFMDTLDDNEKIEFVQIFLEKTKGQIKGVPEYRLGQDNTMFFPAIFIHINRAREIVSTHLLEKIYKQIGKD